MQPLPRVGAEVQRINAAFSVVSDELSGVLTVLRRVGMSTTGTPAADPAVSAGMADLESALGRLRTTAEECVSVMSRHGVELPSQDAPPAGRDASPGPQPQEPR